jgi:formamidopyrimidine-DNA glycosylase
MPELPEVETVVRDLRPLAVGRMIRAVRHGKKKLRVPWQPSWNAKIAGSRIEAIRRRGKWIVLELLNEPRGSSPRLLAHLGMTGRLTTIPQAPASHCHIVFELDDGVEIQFFDPRRFGSIAFHEGEADLQSLFKEKRLGPEPEHLNVVGFSVLACNTSRNLKSILLDQRVVAGIGNIYANEACFLAQIHPLRQGASLTRTECQRLVRAIKAVIRRAIRHRGTTLEDEGFLGGAYQNRLSVYGRTSQDCRNCRSAIERIVVSGRATYFCPACQPPPRLTTSEAIVRRERI